MVSIAGMSRTVLVAILFVAGHAARPATASETPQPLSEQIAVYPPKAYDEKIEGSVKILFDLTENGKPTNIKVVESSPPGIFDGSAKDAVEVSTYAPTVVDGKRVPVTGLSRTIIYKVANALLGPKPVEKPQPWWPEAAVVTKTDGKCDVDFIVNPDGSVSEAEISASWPGQIFDQVCLEAIRKWKFEPATYQGKPTSIRQYYRFNFVNPLEKGPPYMKPGQWITFRYTLNHRGEPTDVEVVAQSDDNVAVTKAYRQLKLMRFKPVVENGEPVDKPGQTMTIKGSVQ